MPRTGVILLSLALAAGSAAPLIAQDDTPRLDGRDFAGLRLEAPLQAHDVSLSASYVSAWSEGHTRRLLLDQDTEIAIGPYRFRAARAVVWIERIRLRDEPDAPIATQLAIYFDTVRTPGAAPSVNQSADRLLVTALVSGRVQVSADQLDHTRPYGPFIGDAEFRLSQRLTELVASGAPSFARPATARAGWRPPPAYRLDLIETPADPDAPDDQTAPYIPDQAVVTFHGPDRTLVTGDSENALVITGGIAVQYEDVAQGKRLHLSADSAVVFLAPRDLSQMDSFAPEDVLGVYLEGGVVATDGDYTMRGPRMYYDINANTGVVLDAVFWTYDQRRDLPLYLRADVIRQEADDRWRAENARFANVEFFEPHFAIGATDVALTRNVRTDGSQKFSVDAKGVNYLIGDSAIAPLPGFKGEVAGSRAPKFSVRTRDGNPIIYSRWDLFGLAGAEPPDGVTADLLVDGYIERGAAVGIDAQWDTLENTGELFTYYFHDDGTDDLGSGAEIDRDNESRGTLLAENRWALNSEWTLFTEAAVVSDPAFFDAVFQEIADTRRELRTGAYLRRLQDDSLLSFDVSGSVNDFITNEYLLQSRGYQVARLPEIRYDTFHTDVAEAFWGKGVTHFGETRAGVLKLQLSDESADEYGLDTIERAQRGLGLLPGQSPEDALEAAGYPTREVARFDTRHELSAPIRYNAWTLTPRAVGRLTAYDNDFDDFSPGQDDQARFWGAIGGDLTTSFVRVDDQVNSAFWDLHRLRHIIEPKLSLWWADSNVSYGELPIFDEEVEGAAEGALFRAGIKNTWQTKRGGVGALRSVDWITLDVDYVNASGDAPDPLRLGRVFDDRPEQGAFGQYVQAAGTMWLTDAVAVVSTGVYDFDDNNGTYYTAGVFIDHGVGFSTFADFRYLDVIDSTLLHTGVAYRLTNKYALEGHVQYDFEDREFQTTSASISRRFPQWTVRAGVSYDDLRDDTSFRIVFRPVGLGDHDRRLSIFPEERDARAPESVPLSAPRRFGG